MKWTSNQDQEDYEQEKLIEEFLRNNPNADVGFDYKYITRSGKCRSSIGQHKSLDEKLFTDSAATRADFIAGSDGRDQVFRGDCDYDLPEASDTIAATLTALGINGELQAWTKKNLLLFQKRK